ncbi:MAG: hypothetical protein LBQ31_05225 [Bacteroidales bacterium]|nr:hypothetical protein [Bacteroidales bacterium]
MTFVGASVVLYLRAIATAKEDIEPRTKDIAVLITNAINSTIKLIIN